VHEFRGSRLLSKLRIGRGEHRRRKIAFVGNTIVHSLRMYEEALPL